MGADSNEGSRTDDEEDLTSEGFLKRSRTTVKAELGGDGGLHRARSFRARSALTGCEARAIRHQSEMEKQRGYTCAIARITRCRGFVQLIRLLLGFGEDKSKYSDTAVRSSIVK